MNPVRSQMGEIIKLMRGLLRTSNGVKNDIVTGLDIGTNTIKALVAQRKQNGWEVLSYAEVPSFGLRKGAVANPEEVSKRVQELMKKVSAQCKRKINSVFVNIGGSHLYVLPSDGIISVSRADQRISKEDIERVLQATKAINIPHNEEVLDVFPKEFIIDDQRGIKQPEGLTGVRLEAKVILLCYFQQYFMNLTQAVIGAKLQINDVIPSVLASANSVLNQEQKELGVVLVDIGANTTSMAVFEESELVHLAVFPIGSANITKDIAIGLKTDVANAEMIKKQYGACILSPSSVPEKKKIEVFDNSLGLDFTKKKLVDIIEPRVSEIFDLVQKELKKINKQEALPAGVVITGGGAKIPKIKELAKSMLKLACYIGKPKGIEGLEPDPALATVAGLVLEAIVDTPDNEGKISGSIILIIKKIARAFVKAFKP